MAEPQLTPQQMEELQKILDERAKKSLYDTGDAAQKAAGQIQEFGESFASAGESAGKFFNQVKSSYEQVKSVGAFSRDQMESFSVLNAALMNTRSYFTGSTDGLSMFSTQLSGLQEFLDRDFNLPGKLDDLKKYVLDSPFKGLIPDLGEFKTLDSLKSKILGVAQNMFTAADNSIKLRQSYIQTAAGVGLLDEVMEKSGKNFERINDVIAHHQAALAATAKANGLTIDTIEKLYTRLGAVPGFFKDATGAVVDNAEQMDKLSKVIQLSLGLGRSQADVIRDLELAYRTYGATGEAAFEFTTKISKITQNYDLDLNRLQSGLNNTARSFSNFTDVGKSANQMLEGTASLYNQLVGSFKETGLTGDRAIDVVGNITNEIGRLTLAQKSFLSAQTGGPGGLMGGLQIEQMLREGKVEEVFGKVRQQIEKQLGTIVTLEEATKSPAAAAQFTRQRTLLMQSPLAKFARTEDEASRVLEVFKGMQEGKGVPKEFEKNIVETTLESGKQLQMQSYTQLSAINGSLEELKTSFFTPMLSTVQKGFALRVGTGGTVETPARAKMQKELENQRAESQMRANLFSQERDKLLSRTPGFKLSEDEAGRQAFAGISSFVGGVSAIPESFRAMADTVAGNFKKALGIGKGAETSDTLKRTIAETADRAIAEPTAAPAAAMVKPEARPAAATTTAAATAAGAGKKPESEVKVSVDVNAVCTSCKEKLESQHAHAVAPATPK